ncbi:MAG TPA: hypothetical protein VN176_17795 [Verrucomicrobiae bacterium]|jgi:hypothetical protein|nr:hypothetical protein [Verrucomicrobiae bacterium]
MTSCGILLLLPLAAGQIQTPAPPQPLAPPQIQLQPPAVAAREKAKSHRPGSTDRPSTPSSMQYGPPAPAEVRPKLPWEEEAVQPRVSYRDGLLTIEAPNSTLGSILNAIHNKTGIQFEGAQSSMDRVAVRTGPAPVDEVVGELLRASHFDYVILGREDNPRVVQRVILTRQGSAPATTQPNPPDSQTQTQEAVDEADPENLRQQPGVRPPPQPLVQTQPQTLPNGARTPEQMLEEMRQQQLRRRQQQPNGGRPDDPPLE